MRRLLPLVLAAGLIFIGSFNPARGDPPRKVVLLAGPLDAGHPRGTHEYERAAMLLKHCLDTSPNLSGVTTELHLGGWPADPATLDSADTIVVIASGSDRREADHPLLVGDRLAALERQMNRGCGLVVIHWATFFPARHAEKMLDWTGGFFDYETGDTPNRWYSAIAHWQAEARPADGEHPVLRGVGTVATTEEWYYNIRFREGDKRVRPILITRPPGEKSDHAVAWAIDRAPAGKGRGFATTGGHHYGNWFNPSFRRMILNAIVWTAGAEVPSVGVEDSAGDRPVRALILTGHDGPFHNWRATSTALKNALERDPRLFVEISENIEDLAMRDLKGLDLLVLDYCNWDRPGLSDTAKDKFVEYLKSGGGLSVIHFANGAFHSSLPNNPHTDWPEYRRIVRRVWEHGKSGHDPFGPFTVRIADAEHPITQGLADFETIDELYFNQIGDEPIEPLAVARSKITGRDEPQAWVYPYGQGRVFQTVLGHANESIEHAAALITRGSVWAAGHEPWEVTK